MERVIFAEVLGRRDQVVDRVRIDRFPFRVGRAYTNDLILDDRQVSEEHLLIDATPEGEIVARDLGSVNGIHRVEPAERVHETRIESGDLLRAGRTVIRFCSPDHPVGPAAVSPTGSPGDWLTSHWGTAVVALTIVAATSAAATVQTTYREVDPLDVLSNTALKLIATIGWAGAWALVSRLLHHRTCFVSHCVATCAFLIGLQLIDSMMSFVRFFSAPLVPIEVTDFAIRVGLAAALLVAQLRLATALAPFVRLTAAVVVAAVLLGTTQVARYTTWPDFISELPYWSRLKPIDPAWLSTTEVGTFFDEARGLKAEVDELVKED